VRRTIVFLPLGLPKRGRTDVADVSPHVANERFDSVDGSRDDEPAVIEPETYPQIVHEHRESDHHGSDAPWSAEFPPGKSQCELGRGERKWSDLV
jgi:hypothetical protein